MKNIKTIVAVFSTIFTVCYIIYAAYYAPVDSILYQQEKAEQEIEKRLSKYLKPFSSYYLIAYSDDRPVDKINDYEIRVIPNEEETELICYVITDSWKEKDGDAWTPKYLPQGYHSEEHLRKRYIKIIFKKQKNNTFRRKRDYFEREDVIPANSYDAENYL